jgi:hypothetical protein
MHFRRAGWQAASSFLPELPVGNFFDLPVSVFPRRLFFGAQARWSIIDQMLQIPNFSMLLCGVLEVFRRGTISPSSLIRCGSERMHREKEKAKEISLLWAWHGPCSVLRQRWLPRRRDE